MTSVIALRPTYKAMEMVQPFNVDKEATAILLGSLYVRWCQAAQPTFFFRYYTGPV